MAFKDILVALTSYPEPPSASVVQAAVAVAESLGAHITALSCEVHIELPGHFISGSAFGLPGIIAEEVEKSRRQAQELLVTFEAAASKADIPHETYLQKCKSFEVPDVICEFARLRDLTILPQSADRWDPEAVIFGAGRPVLVLPRTRQSGPFEVGTVVVAWDFSRAAARAVSDAITLLERAKAVRIVTVYNEKDFDRKHSAEELSKNLSRHGIEVELDKIDAENRQIGDVLNDYATSHRADMLVMGAYGHSRLREFILGGATASMLSKPTLPIMFSH